MSWARGRSSGWAAFDFKQRQGHGLEVEFENDSYPPLPNTASLGPSDGLVTNSGPLGKSFSSLLQPPMNFIACRDKSDCKSQIQTENSGRKLGIKIVEERNSPVDKLKKLHGWANDSLIDDILEAVNNDVDQASDLLKAMSFSDYSEDSKVTKVADLSITSENCPHDSNTLREGECDPLQCTAELVEQSHILKRLYGQKKEATDKGVSSEIKLSDGGACAQPFLGLMAVPVEPEWEEDDVYLIHRKDALRMIRSASQHSRAATNAFLRGDHYSAQQLSLKAQEEQKAAESLNAKAAKEILGIRNNKNDYWKLDLHGLHAAEAVKALHEHLQKIERQIPCRHSVSPKRVTTKAENLCSQSLDSVSCRDVEVIEKQQTLSRQRRMVLEVITGTGNHSRGQAALPAVVRSFLVENRYHFDEPRPGVITVWPKFRPG